MYYDKLAIYKKHLRRERRLDTVLLIWQILFTALILWGVCAKPQAFLILLLPLALWALLLPRFLERRRLWRELGAIKERKAINKTYDITLYRPRVTFMIRTEGGRGYRAHYLYGIRIKAPDKRKYYYLFDELLHYEKENVQRIEEKLYRELTIQCYEGTSIIRTIEKDPHFLRIRWGDFVA